MVAGASNPLFDLILSLSKGGAAAPRQPKSPVLRQAQAEDFGAIVGPIA